MNRRNFLSLFSAGVAGIALEQAIPLGRVWSFPKKIIVMPPAHRINLSGPRFDIGDVVTIQNALGVPGYLGPFIVTNVYDGGVELKAPRHMITGIAPTRALEPFYPSSDSPGTSNPPLLYPY